MHKISTPTLLTTLALALALPSLALPSAPKSAYVLNNCPFDIHVTSVNSNAGPTQRVQSLVGKWSEPQSFDGRTGQAITVTTAATPYENAPVLTFGYTFHAEVPDVYYDLGTTYGYDFWGENVTLQGESRLSVPEIVWVGGPEGQDTKHYVGRTNLYLTLCAGDV